MTKTLESMTIEELQAAWEVAYTYYQTSTRNDWAATGETLNAIANAMAKKVGA